MSAGNKFSKVSPAVWWSKRFRALPTSEAKLLYLYYLASERQNSSGCFQAHDGHVLADLGWSTEIYYPARQALVDADLIAFDSETETVYVRRWFKHCPPNNPDHAEGTRKIIERIESDQIREIVEGEFQAVEEVMIARINARAVANGGIAATRIGRMGR